MHKDKSRGFTLIELLVVISIISLLTSVILASLNSARERAEISKTIQNISSIQKALELYYADHNSYPNVSSPLGNYDDLTSTVQVLVNGGYLPDGISFPSFFNYSEARFYVNEESVHGSGYECIEQGAEPTGSGPANLVEDYMINFESTVLLPYKELFVDGNSTDLYCITY